jgi:hypothetical protein
MKRTFPLSGWLIATLSFSSPSFAQIAESTFAVDADGWMSVTLPYPSAVPPTIVASFSPNWDAALGGYIWLVDPDGTTTGNTEYWQAPAKYLGAKSSAYGGALSFDLANAPGVGLFHQEDVILLGGGLTLVYDLGSAPGGAFAHYSVPLSEAGWKRDGLGGPAATQAEFLTALASITQIFIRAEFQLGTDTEYLDNCVMSAPVTGVGSPAAPALVLNQNVPNPFNPSTLVSLSVDRDTALRVQVYDVAGIMVRRLWDGPVSRGEHAFEWDGRDSRGRAVASGVYYCRATAGSMSQFISMVLLK